MAGLQTPEPATFAHRFARHGVLEPLARTSRSAVVVDKYLFKKLLGRGRKPDPEQVIWLLENLDSSIHEGTVTLIGQVGSGSSSAIQIADTILQHWRRHPAHGVHQLRVVLAPGRSLPHDRHVRFGVGGVVILPAGFDRLSEPFIWDKDGMNWQYKWQPEAVKLLKAAETRCFESNNTDQEELNTARGE